MPNFQRLQLLARSLVRIESRNTDGSVSIGTAIAVAPDLFVTNCHVTARARNLVLIYGGETFPVEAQDADMTHDLCMLRSEGLRTVPLVEIALDEPQVGQTVYALGYVLGLPPRLGFGRIEAMYDYDGGTVIQTDTPFASGASGGALLDEQGRLLGVLTFRYRGGALQFSMASRWVRHSIRRSSARLATRRDDADLAVRPLAGAPFWQEPDTRQPFFLRAARLAAEAKWTNLRELAQDWTEREPTNASAWETLGSALLALEQVPAAIVAVTRSLELERGRARSWLLAGCAARRGGRDDLVGQAVSRLRELAPALLQEFSEGRGCEARSRRE